MIPFFFVQYIQVYLRKSDLFAGISVPCPKDRPRVNCPFDPCSRTVCTRFPRMMAMYRWVKWPCVLCFNQDKQKTSLRMSATAFFFQKPGIFSFSEWCSIGITLNIFFIIYTNFFVLNMEDNGVLRIRTLVNYFKNCNTSSLSLLDLNVVLVTMLNEWE